MGQEEGGVWWGTYRLLLPGLQVGLDVRLECCHFMTVVLTDILGFWSHWSPLHTPIKHRRQILHIGGAKPQLQMLHIGGAKPQLHTSILAGVKAPIANCLCSWVTVLGA
jgi:hypothetical protein